MFREEKTASAKAPRWELAWCVRTPAVMLEQNEQGESQGGRAEGARTSIYRATEAISRTLAFTLHEMRSHWKVLNKGI